MDVVEYTQEVPADVLEAYFKSQGPIVLPSPQLQLENTSSADLLQVEGDRVIFNPQGPDPLGIRGYELQLPPEPEQAQKLGFAFGGQPVIFDDDPSAALPIIGFSVPNGGPSYNVLEDMGFDVQKLSQGVLAPRLPPHLRDATAAVAGGAAGSVTGGAAGSAIGGAAGSATGGAAGSATGGAAGSATGGAAGSATGGAAGDARAMAPLQTVDDLLQKASRRIALRRKTDPSDGLSATVNRRNAQENKFVQTGSSLRYKSPTIGRNTNFDAPNDARWNYPLNAYRLATYEEELQRKARDCHHRPERPGLCGGDLTRYSHLAASALQQTQGWLSAMMPHQQTSAADPPLKTKEEAQNPSRLKPSAAEKKNKKSSKRKLNGENAAKTAKLTPDQQAALAQATMHHQFTQAQRLAVDQHLARQRHKANQAVQNQAAHDQAAHDQAAAVYTAPHQYQHQHQSDAQQIAQTKGRKGGGASNDDDTIYKITTLRGTALNERSPRRTDGNGTCGVAGVTVHGASGLALPGTATSIPLDFSALPELLRKACEEPNSISLREPLVKHDPNMPMTAIPTLLERPRVLHPGITAEQIEQAKLEAIAEGRVKPSPSYAPLMSAADQLVFASHAQDAETAARTQLASHAKITEQATLYRHEQANKWLAATAAPAAADTSSEDSPIARGKSTPAETATANDDPQLRENCSRGGEEEKMAGDALPPGQQVDHLEPIAAAEVPKGPLPSKVFKIASAIGQREVEMVPLCDNPRIELIREFLSEDECQKIQSIIERVEAYPHSPNNLFVNEDLSEDNRHFLERIAKRMAGITKIPFEDFVAICPSVVNLTAMDATKDFSNIVRIYLDPRCEGCESDFPYLGVSVCPHKGAAIRWQTKNERGFKLTRSTHSEIIGDASNASRRFLTAYIR